MLSVSAISSSNAAGSYYEKDDYYTHESPPSEWQGQGAKDLGLKGEVDPEAFKKMLDGKLPNGEQLGTMRGGELQHKPGWDLTFSAPKSVSIMAEAGSDERLIKAHDEAVKAALQHVEREAAMTRIRMGEQVAHVATNNLTAATFRHDLSRDKDPQLHTHSVVVNATKTPDGTWRSLESRHLYRIQKEAGLVYRQVLAEKVKAAGYQLDSAKAGKDWSFEIKGVSQTIREHFSGRSAEIKKALAERGKDRETATAKEKEVATLNTRSQKDHDTDREQLRESWRSECAKQGLDVDALRKQAEERAAQPEFIRQNVEQSQFAASESVRWAAEHISERNAQFSTKDIAKTAFEKGEGTASMSDIHSAIKAEIQAGNIVNRGGDAYTTPQAIQTERQNAGLEMRGRGQAEAVAKPTLLDRARGLNTAEAKASKVIEKAELQAAKKGYAWTADQRAATKGLLTNSDRVVGIQGAAGSAKTSTVIHTFAKEVQKSGGKVVGMAPTNTAAEQLRDGGGIKDSCSIARHLANLKQEERAIANLRYKAKGQDFKAKGQDFKAAQVGKGGGIAVAKDGTVLQKNLLSKGWSKADLPSAVAIRTGLAAKKIFHQSKSMAASGRAADLKEQAAAKEQAMQGQTWVVDEASMISAKQMNELLKAAEKYDAKVVLVGDKQQLASVGAGRAFEQMQEGGMKTFRLDEIVRQKDVELKKAVEAAYKGDSKQALEKIESLGGVRETQNPSGDREAGMQARAEAIARDYSSMSKADRQQSIIVAPGNDDRKAINEAVRGELKAKGEIGKEDKQVEALAPKSLSEAEKRSAASYQKGDVVRFNSANKSLGVEKGEYAKVAGRDGDKVKLGLKDGRQVNWNPAARGSGAGRSEAYKSEQRGFAQGDRLQFTRNDASKGVSNRSAGTVESIRGDKMTVKLDSGKSVKVDLSKPEGKHLEHGYASTAHAAQGATAKTAFVHAESHRSNLTTQKSVYVSVSRAQAEVKIYTDNKEALKQAVATRSGEKSAAMDRGPKTEPAKSPQSASNDAGKDQAPEKSRANQPEKDGQSKAEPVKPQTAGKEQRQQQPAKTEPAKSPQSASNDAGKDQAPEKSRANQPEKDGQSKAEPAKLQQKGSMGAGKKQQASGKSQASKVEKSGVGKSMKSFGKDGGMER